MVADPSNGPTGTGVAGVAPVRQQPARQDAPQQAPNRKTAAPAKPSDVTDVEAAVHRLDQLLRKDTDSKPRQDVPQKGFYLNIVV